MSRVLLWVPPQARDGELSEEDSMFSVSNDSGECKTRGASERWSGRDVRRPVWQDLGLRLCRSGGCIAAIQAVHGPSLNQQHREIKSRRASPLPSRRRSSTRSGPSLLFPTTLDNSHGIPLLNIRDTVGATPLSTKACSTLRLLLVDTPSIASSDVSADIAVLLDHTARPQMRAA